MLLNTNELPKIKSYDKYAYAYLMKKLDTICWICH